MIPEMMYELRVLTGLHQGAALPLTGREWTIGSSTESDLALHDPGIEGRHCLLQLVDDTWTLARQNGVVTDIEGHKVDVITPLLPGSAFALNGVWLSLVSANTNWAEEDHFRSKVEIEGNVQQSSAEFHEARPEQSVAPTRSWLALTLMLSAAAVFLLALFLSMNREKPSAPPPPLQPVFCSKTLAP